MFKRSVLLTIFLVLTAIATLSAGMAAIQKREFTPDDYSYFYDCIRDAHYCYDEVVECIQFGIDVNLADTWGFTPLHIAARYDRPATTELLINSGARIEAKNAQGETALWLAARHANHDALDVLLRHGANISSCNHSGMSILLTASIYNSTDYQKMLAQAKQPDFSPLVYESLVGSRHEIRALIDAGESVDQANSYGWNPLQICIRNPFWRDGFSFRQTTMIESSKNLNILSPQGDNLLNLAALGGDHWTIRHLIKKGVSPNHQNSLKETPLIQLFKYGYWRWAPILLQSGANPNLQDKDGWTALMYAARNCYQWSIFNDLLQAGADLQLRNQAGSSALDIATQYSNKVAMDILREYRPSFRN